MYLLYLDEFGHPGPYDKTDPRHRHHPLFGFAGVAVEGRSWRDLDRGFLRLKGRYYANELRKALYTQGLRPERWEPKQLRSRRDKRFAADVLHMAASCHANAFAFGCIKRSTVATHSQEGLYNSQVQGVLRQFEKFLRNVAGVARGRGTIIMDRRGERLNQVVLASAQSHLFSSPALKGPAARIVETPLLVPSEFYHGVQVADMVGRIVAAVSRYRLLGDTGYRWADRQLGGPLDAITLRLGKWTSVFVK